MISKAILYSSTVLTISELREISLDTFRISDEDKENYKKVQKRCQQKNIQAMTQDDDNHFKFSTIYSAPYVIYALGNLDILNSAILGVVGPRKVSQFAKRVMNNLFISLKDFDVVTVSGLADGVDTICHRLSLEHNIPTIAVLGGGLAHFLQSGKRAFIEEIVAKGGLVLSEFKLTQTPAYYTFPQRNRIIAGLSDMLFLPEAGKKSGSLITVDFANKMHKDVYGVPNSIFSQNSQGLLEAMQNSSVKPVIDFTKMLEQYFGKKTRNLDREHMHGKISQAFSELSDNEVLLFLQRNPDGLGLNELSDQSGLATEEIMSQLSVAEVMGYVVNDGGVWKIRNQ